MILEWNLTLPLPDVRYDLLEVSYERTASSRYFRTCIKAHIYLPLLVLNDRYFRETTDPFERLCRTVFYLLAFGIEQHCSMPDKDLEQQSSDASFPQSDGSSSHERCWRMGGHKPFPATIADRKAYVVEYDGPTDARHPKNWPSSTRWVMPNTILISRTLTGWNRLWISVIVCFGTLISSFDSAVFGSGAAKAAQEFSVGEEVGILGTTLYVLGFASGPLIWAPGSELLGRRWPLVVGMFGCLIFTIASATSKDIQTLTICRFFAGVFGASPLCVVPAVLSDMYDDLHRGTAISIYAL